MTTENKFTLTIPGGETAVFRTASLPMPVILHVSPDGAFTWHEDAGRLIEEGNFTGMGSTMQHILRALWKAHNRKPLTREQVKALMKPDYDNATMQERADFMTGFRAAETAYDIGTPSCKENAEKRTQGQP